jgi:uncharacterized membrane protein
MTEYERYRIKEADICDCKHVQGSHAGTHFGIGLMILAFIIFSGLPLQYASVDLKLVTPEESALIWGIVMAIGIYFVMFLFDNGCTFCTCKKFKWSGRNEYD